MQASVNSTSGAPRLGTGCLILFMLPFFGMGSFAVWSGIKEMQRGKSGPNAYVPIVVGGFFIAVSLAITAAAMFGFRAAAANAALKSQYPDKPWLWRKEWSEGVIVSHGGTQSVVFAFFALFWNAIAIPIAYLAFQKPDVRGEPVMYFVLIFPIVGVILLISAAYQLLRARKYGQSRLMLAHIPISLGTACRGEIATHVKERPENGFAVKLQCLRRYVTGSGKNRSTHETELWRDEQQVSGAAAMPTMDGFRVPFSIDVARDNPSTNDSDPSDQIVWRLNVAAETPGIDYAAQFELPVFETAESNQHEIRRFVPSATEVSAWTPSPESGISVEGNEIHIRTRARAKDTMTTLIFCILWFGAVALMLKLGAPIVFPLAFGVFGLLVVYAVIDSLLGHSTIRADRSGIVWQRAWIGTGRTRTIGEEHIKSVVANPTSSSSSYEVDVIGLGGQKTQIAANIRERRDAEMLAARIQRAVSAG